jgi:hypothetical protein
VHKGVDDELRVVLHFCVVEECKDFLVENVIGAQNFLERKGMLDELSNEA